MLKRKKAKSLKSPKLYRMLPVTISLLNTAILVILLIICSNLYSEKAFEVKLKEVISTAEDRLVQRLSQQFVDLSKYCMQSPIYSGESSFEQSAAADEQDSNDNHDIILISLQALSFLNRGMDITDVLENINKKHEITTLIQYYSENKEAINVSNAYLRLQFERVIKNYKTEQSNIGRIIKITAARKHHTIKSIHKLILLITYNELSGAWEAVQQEDMPEDSYIRPLLEHLEKKANIQDKLRQIINTYAQNDN